MSHKTHHLSANTSNTQNFYTITAIQRCIHHSNTHTMQRAVQWVWVSNWETVVCGVLTIESSSRDPSGLTPVYSSYWSSWSTALHSSIKLIALSCLCSVKTKLLEIGKTMYNFFEVTMMF